MTTVRAAVDIDAPLDRVFDVLLDFARYAEWNPFVVGVTGEARVGATIVLDVHFHDGRRGRSREHVDVLTRADQRSELAYSFAGTLSTLGLVRARRRHVLTAIDPHRTRYETDELFTGVLVRFVPVAGVQRGFDEAATALKHRAERITLPGPSLVGRAESPLLRVDQALDRARSVDVRQHEQHVARADRGLASRDDHVGAAQDLDDQRSGREIEIREALADDR